MQHSTPEQIENIRFKRFGATQLCQEDKDLIDSSTADDLRNMLADDEALEVFHEISRQLIWSIYTRLRMIDSGYANNQLFSQTEKLLAAKNPPVYKDDATIVVNDTPITFKSEGVCSDGLDEFKRRVILLVKSYVQVKDGVFSLRPIQDIENTPQYSINKLLLLIDKLFVYPFNDTCQCDTMEDAERLLMSADMSATLFNWTELHDAFPPEYITKAYNLSTYVCKIPQVLETPSHSTKTCRELKAMIQTAETQLNHEMPNKALQDAFVLGMELHPVVQTTFLQYQDTDTRGADICRISNASPMLVQCLYAEIAKRNRPTLVIDTSRTFGEVGPHVILDAYQRIQSIRHTALIGLVDVPQTTLVLRTVDCGLPSPSVKDKATCAYAPKVFAAGTQRRLYVHYKSIIKGRKYCVSTLAHRGYAIEAVAHRGRRIGRVKARQALQHILMATIRAKAYPSVGCNAREYVIDGRTIHTRFRAIDFRESMFDVLAYEHFKDYGEGKG